MMDLYTDAIGALIYARSRRHLHTSAAILPGHVEIVIFSSDDDIHHEGIVAARRRRPRRGLGRAQCVAAMRANCQRRDFPVPAAEFPRGPQHHGTITSADGGERARERPWRQAPKTEHETP